MEDGKSRQQSALPPLAFGSWQAAGWDSSEEHAFVRTLEAALAAGVRFIDTAPAYGKGYAESLIGETIQGVDRDSLYIATKFNHYESSPARVRLSVERSLSRLRCDYIDLYQQHWPAKKPAFERTLSELLKLKAEGLIRSIGVCNWTEKEFSVLAAEDVAHIDTLQVCYSLLWRANETALREIAERGIAVLAYSPLAQGLLADASLIDRVFTDHRQKNVLFSSELRPAVQEVQACVLKIATAHAVAPAAVALSWVMQRKFITSVLVGQSCAEQLAGNLAATRITLSPTEEDELEAASHHFIAAFSGYDTMWGWHSLRPTSGGKEKR